MKYVVFIISICMAFLSCNSNSEVNASVTENVPAPNPDSKLTPQCSAALKFINAYTTYCNSHASGVVDWIEVDSSVTEHFKTTYRTILDSAFKADPEMGLGFNPVFDAQDSPDKGFEVVDCDNATGYVTVKGKDSPDFMLVLKVVLQDNNWLVDGSGIINIPKDKRAKRK